MEPITLCGLVIVMFGFWVEFEPAVTAVMRKIRNSALYSKLFSPSVVQASICTGKMPICLAKSFH